MRRRLRAISLGAAVAAALAAAAPAGAQTPADPPEVLAPGDGAASVAGAPVTFRVRTYPGDDYLWALFSRSPAPVNACGTIGQDVGLVSLEPTGPDPSVYEGTPRLFDNYTFWLNRPGTYYWQAYRINHAGGADGCVEAPVRSLTITGQRPIEIGPQPLEPADGAVTVPGQLTFRATGLTGDTSLWIHVSRSPERVDTGGLLGDDVELERLEPTGEPGVFAARPTYYSGSSFWMNQPGTYHWQPYRISSFGDPDGYVEGPVRSFTIRPLPPAKPLALTASRLAGDFTATERVTGVQGFSTRVGRTNRSTWTFTPQCRTGACSVRLTLYSGILGSQRRQMRLTRHGSRYAGSGTFRVASCAGSPVVGRMAVSLRVTRGAWITSRWRATRISGTFRTTVGRSVVGRVRCPAGFLQAGLTGQLQRGS